MKTLEEYLKDNFYEDSYQSILRISHIDENDNPHIYIHPHGRDGETLDFVVTGNEIHPKR
jgi:hypothetical protein